MKLGIIARSCLLLVVAAGCTPPLRVRHVDPEDFYREQTTNVLSSNDVSDVTRTVLRRHDLLEQYRDKPADTIAALHGALVAGRGGSDEIFALAELSLFRAER